MLQLEMPYTLPTTVYAGILRRQVRFLVQTQNIFHFLSNLVIEQVLI